jgi:MGT family glycosyltransferase
VARFLFVVPDFVGHINPTIPVGLELARRGHATAWTGIPGTVNELLPPECLFISAAPDGADDLLPLNDRFRGLRGAAALKFLWYEALLPMARLMIDGVRAAARDFRADVLVVDQQALAGAVVARQLGLPWATLATTSAELAEPLADWPVVARALRDARVALQLEAGVAPAVAEEGDLLFSPHLVLAFTTAALVGDAASSFPEHVHLVGPSTVGRGERGEFPWSWLDPARPAVLVSLGTVNVLEGERFFGVVAEAVASLPVQAVMVAPPELLPSPPPNVLVRSHVPQLALLQRVQAVVSHGGHNTVCESLAAGVPLVLAPIRTDQPIVADQVVRAGCGIRVSFARVGAAELRSAIDQVLTDPALRAGADAVRRSFAAASGPAGAADHLEQLAYALSGAA